MLYSFQLFVNNNVITVGNVPVTIRVLVVNLTTGIHANIGKVTSYPITLLKLVITYRN